MSLITWDDSLSVKVSLFDNQHKKLVDLINTLNDAMRDGKGKEVLEPIIKELVNYAVMHFSAEESYFKKYGYAGASQHIAEHRAFVNEVEKFKKEFEAGSVGLSVKVMSFLSNWLKSHIMGTDKKYSDFFNQHGLT